MKKILYMQYPPITSYPTHANLLACLSQYEDYLEWFFENYMNIYTNTHPDYIDGSYVDFFAPIPWRSNPHLHSQRLSRELFDVMKTGLVDFFINAIDQGNYIFLYLNRFYLSASYTYQKNNDVHDVFIYGYDKDSKLFNIADFFAYSKYTLATASFDEITSAYKGYNDDWKESEFDLRNVDGIVLIKPLLSAAYSYKVTNTLQGLKDYLGGTTTSGCYSFGYRIDCEYDEFHSLKNSFGVNIYHYLEKYLISLGTCDQYIDYRGFYVIYEHKKLLKLYLEYLESKWLLDVSELKNLLKPVLTGTQALYLYFMKKTLSNDQNYADAIQKVNAIQQDDIKFISGLIDFLEKNEKHFKRQV